MDLCFGVRVYLIKTMSVWVYCEDVCGVCESLGMCQFVCLCVCAHGSGRIVCQCLVCFFSFGGGQLCAPEVNDLG